VLKLLTFYSQAWRRLLHSSCNCATINIRLEWRRHLRARVNDLLIS